MNPIAMNKKPPIYTEVMPDGGLLIIGDKAKIEYTNKRVTGLCLDLRHWYDSSNGFIDRKTRTDREVIDLGKKWAEGIYLKR